MNRRVVSSVFAVLLSAIAAVAQAPVMTVPSGILSRGTSINIGYRDASKPNTSVTITIDDGAFPTPLVTTVTVVLDGSGEGFAVWRIPPTWSLASFNAPGVREQTRLIQ